MRFWRTLLAPLWVIELATSSKSLIDNPIMGSRRLNAIGLHVVRVRIAAWFTAMRRRRLAKRLDPVDVAAFERDGFLMKRDFLPPEQFTELRDQVLNHAAPAREMTQGDTVTQRFAVDPQMIKALPALREMLAERRWRQLIRYVGSYDVEPLIYVQAILANRVDDQPDPQTTLHADAFHSTVKAWLFLTDVAEDDGPFVYVPGSHKMDAKRLAWEQARSITVSELDRLSARGSFRIDAAELPTLGLPQPRSFAVPANTLVVADTHGFHARGASSGQSTRIEIWAYQRRNPFLPWTGLDLLGLPGIAERKVQFWSWLTDRYPQLFGPPWHDAGVKKPGEWSQ